MSALYAQESPSKQSSGDDNKGDSILGYHRSTITVDITTVMHCDALWQRLNLKDKRSKESKKTINLNLITDCKSNETSHLIFPAMINCVPYQC